VMGMVEISHVMGSLEEVEQSLEEPQTEDDLIELRDIIVIGLAAMADRLEVDREETADQAIGSGANLDLAAALCARMRDAQAVAERLIADLDEAPEDSESLHDAIRDCLGGWRGFAGCIAQVGESRRMLG
jgi:hypothetical protein